VVGPLVFPARHSGAPRPCGRPESSRRRRVDLESTTRSTFTPRPPARPSRVRTSGLGARPERHRARPSPVARIRLRESVPSCPWRGSTASDEHPRASPRWSASIFQGRCRFAGQHPLIHVLTFPQAPSELCRRPRLLADRVQPADQSSRLLGCHRPVTETPLGADDARIGSLAACTAGRSDVPARDRQGHWNTAGRTVRVDRSAHGSPAPATAEDETQCSPSRRPCVPTSLRPDVPASRRPCVPTSLRPDVPASRRPCVRTVSWGTAVVSPIGAAHRSGSPHECDASRVRRRSSPMQASSRPLRRSPCR